MRVVLNGEPRELPDGATVADAVRGERRAAVARGASRWRWTARSSRAARWGDQPLAEGQQVEVAAGGAGWLSRSRSPAASSARG